MINPQMMGMGQLPNMPTVKELWKDEKSKYRHWMILFGIGIAVIFAFLLSSIILNVLDADSVKTGMAKDAWTQLGPSGQNFPGYPSDIGSFDPSDTLKTTWASIPGAFRSKYIIWPSVQLALVGIGLFLFLATLAQSYQEKSFHKLSPLASGVIFIGAMMSIYQLFSLIWHGTSGSFNSKGGLFQFITYFITIVVYFSGSVQVSKIRRLFAQSFRLEQIKNSPEYQAAMQQMQAMQNGQMPNGFANGPFGPSMGTPQGNSNNFKQPGQQPGQPGQQPQTQAAPAKSSERMDLESMTVADLKKVASKLEISGASTMKKIELVEAILRVTENK